VVLQEGQVAHVGDAQVLGQLVDLVEHVDRHRLERQAAHVHSQHRVLELHTV
jgi:hypothetical protein